MASPKGREICSWRQHFDSRCPPKTRRPHHARSLDREVDEPYRFFDGSEGTDLTGTYTSADSSKGGRITGALKGYGDRISFLVLWPGGSMTAWTGQLVND